MIAIGTPANGRASPGSIPSAGGQRRLVRDVGERVDRGLELVDPAQRRLDELARGQLAGADQSGQLGGGTQQELGRGTL